MRPALVILLCIFLVESTFCQLKTNIGQLKFINSKIIKAETVQEEICGITTSVIRLTVIAKTRCQLSCNFGDPSSNIYDTVTNRLYVCYRYDSSGVLNKTIVKEIERNANDQYTFVKHDSTETEYQDFPLNKSFFVDNNQPIPFIWSGAERAGDYQIFYVNKRAYKIILAEGNGFGSLSLFTHQNILFKQ